MGNMDGWDLTLLLVAGYLAVVFLVRLMTNRRNQMLGQLRGQMEKEKRLKEAERQSQEPRRQRAG